MLKDVSFCCPRCHYPQTLCQRVICLLLIFMTFLTKKERIFWYGIFIIIVIFKTVFLKTFGTNNIFFFSFENCDVSEQVRAEVDENDKRIWNEKNINFLSLYIYLFFWNISSIKNFNWFLNFCYFSLISCARSWQWDYMVWMNDWLKIVGRDVS